MAWRGANCGSGDQRKANELASMRNVGLISPNDVFFRPEGCCSVVHPVRMPCPARLPSSGASSQAPHLNIYRDRQ